PAAAHGQCRGRTAAAAARAGAALLARSRHRRPAPVKLLRTIRLDPSDAFVFERAAEPGEWAVSGAFMFADADPDTLTGKQRAAFRGGFLGVTSLGWSTLVQIVEAGEEDRAALVAALAGQLRSEEHTSELQSLTNLVCRLLLEKKKTERRNRSPTA